MISETKDNNPIPTNKESRNNNNGPTPNHGNFPTTKKIILPQKVPTISILTSVLKKV
jgi:hypothetical protein